MAAIRRVVTCVMLTCGSLATTTFAGFSYVSADRLVEARALDEPSAGGDHSLDLGFFSGAIELRGATATIESHLDPNRMDFSGDLLAPRSFLQASTDSQVVFDVFERTPVFVTIDIDAQALQDVPGSRATVLLRPEQGPAAYSREVGFAGDGEHVFDSIALLPGRYTLDFEAFAVGRSGGDAVAYDVSVAVVPLPPAAWAGLVTLACAAAAAARMRRGV